MNHDLTTFDFNRLPVRVIKIDGEPWFVAKDVADMLGFKTTASAGWYARHLDEDERNTITLSQGGRGNPNKTVISESGLYKMIMRSDKPEAKKFQDWVTQVVLPSIRKTGAYVAGEENLDLTTYEGIVQMSMKVQAAMQAKLDGSRTEKERRIQHWNTITLRPNEYHHSNAPLLKG